MILEYGGRKVGQIKAKHGFKTTIRHARKRGRSGLNAHPCVLPKEHKPRKPLTKHDWHVAYIIRCVKRGESVRACDL